MRGSVAHFKGHLLTAALVIVVATAFIIGVLGLGGYLPESTSYKLRALLPTSSSTIERSRVTMAGVEVGKVTDIKSQGYATLVSMEITDKSVLPIPPDTRVTLRQRTPVGENYVMLTKGDMREALPENAVLPLRNANEYVDLDEILSVLQGDTRRRTRQFFQRSGSALDSRGAELNVVLGRASEIVQAGGSLLARLDQDRTQTASLVDRLGRVAAAIGERSEAIELTAKQGLVTMQALRSRDDALRDTLEVLPSTLAQVRSTSATLESASNVAAPVITNLAAAMEDLRPAIGQLEPAASTARDVVDELGRSVTPLRGTLAELRRTSAPLSKAFPRLRKTLCQVNPMVRYLAPYDRDVLGFIAGFGSASNSYDSISHVLRIPPVLNENSLAGTLPEDVSRAAFTLLRSGAFLKGSPLSWDPFPAPGQADTNKAPDTGGIFNGSDLRDSGYKYPRIQADC